MSEWLEQIAFVAPDLNPACLRLTFKSHNLYHYKRKIDIDFDKDLYDLCKNYAQKHFLSDARFNLPANGVREVGICAHDSKIDVFYTVDLGLYSNPLYKGAVQTISQYVAGRGSFHELEPIEQAFRKIEREHRVKKEQPNNETEEGL